MAPLKTSQLKDQIELRFRSSDADMETVECMGSTPPTIVRKWMLEEGPWPGNRKAWPQLWGVLSPASDNQGKEPMKEEQYLGICVEEVLHPSGEQLAAKIIVM